MTKKPTTADPPSRRGYADRRARRLVANAYTMLAVAIAPTLGVVSYRITAVELGTPGWTLIGIVVALAGTAGLCLWGAARLQAGLDRADATAAAVAAAFQANPAVVVAGPDTGTAAVVADPVPPRPPLAGFTYLPPDQRPVVLPPGVHAPTPIAAPLEPVVTPDGPEPDPQPAPVAR
jgi:hypothetical protein